MKVFIPLILIGWSLSANTIAAAEASKSSWKGEVELGFVNTTGNTDTESLNAKLKVENTRPDWQHRVQLEILRASDKDVTTAERYDGRYRSQYALSDKDYLFGTLRYEDDRFAGYDQRTTEVVGYGRKILNTKSFKLDIEGGVGGRQSKQTTGTDTSEAIVRVAANFKWHISKTSAFSEDISIEKGEDNTVSESITELKLKINNSLAMKTTYTIKHNSVVPVGTKKTDTRMAVTLVYDF